MNNEHNTNAELAVTNVLRVLLRIYREKPWLFETALLLMAEPFFNGRDLAEALETTPSTVSRRQAQLAANYPELRAMIRMRDSMVQRRRPPRRGGSFREGGQKRGGAGRLDASAKTLDKRSLDNLTGGAPWRDNG